MKKTNIFFVIIITAVLVLSSFSNGSIVSANDSKIVELSYYEEIKNSSKKEVLLIRFKGDNAISYSKTNQAYLAQLYGKNNNGQLTIDEDYIKSLKDLQDSFLTRVNNVIPIKFLMSYQLVFNGAALEISGYNIRYLLKQPEVEKIYFTKDEYYPLRDILVQTIHAVDVWNMLDINKLPVNGEGTKIGIIDSGIDYNHPDFAPLGIGDDKKVISGYDWADDDSDPLDDTSEGHGTHVAGIAAGNNPDDSRKKGVAPQAKLCAYKVFSSKTGAKGAPPQFIISALEQSVKDKCTVVNMSIGNPAPTPSVDEGSPYYEAIKSTRDAGIVVVAAAGNDGSRHKKNPWPIHAPGTFEPAIQVAATTDRSYQAFKAVLPDGFTQTFNPYLSRYTPPFKKEHSGLPVVDASYGRKEDFEKIDVKGKIALISRGPKENPETGDTPITFKEKNLNAKEAGAVGCIVYNYDPEPMGALMYDADEGEDPYSFEFIPNITISGSASKILKRILARGAKLYFDESSFVMISNFTSAGPCLDGDLNIFKPEVSAPGTSINSAYPGGKYVDYQGTSMATPAVTGVVALLKQMHPELEPNDVKAALMNTSDVIKNGLNGEIFSYFYQGAGQVNALSAIQTPLIAYPPSIMKSIEQIGNSISVNLKNITDKVVSVGINTEIFNLSDPNMPLDIEIDKNNIDIQPTLTESFNIKFKVNDDYFEKRKYEGAIWITIKNRKTLNIATEKLHIPFIIYKGKITEIDNPVTDLSISKGTLSMDKEENVFVSFTINSGSYSKISTPSEDDISYLNYASSLTMYVEDEYSNKWGDIYFAENIPVGTYSFYWDGKNLDGEEFLPNGKFLLKIEISGAEITVDNQGQVVDRKDIVTESLKLPVKVSGSSVPEPPLFLIGVQNKVKVDEIFTVNLIFADCKNIKDVNLELSFSKSRLKVLDVFPGEFSDEKNFDAKLGSGIIKITSKRNPNFASKRGKVATIRFSAQKKGFPDLTVSYYKLSDEAENERRAFLRIPRLDILSEEFYLGDFNEDKLVNNLDFGLLAEHYYLTFEDPDWDEKFDLNNDMIIDLDDVIIFSKFYEI